MPCCLWGGGEDPEDIKHKSGNMVTLREPAVDGESWALVPESPSLELGW